MPTHLNDLLPAPRGTLCRYKENRASTRKEEIGRKKEKQRKREISKKIGTEKKGKNERMNEKEDKPGKGYLFKNVKGDKYEMRYCWQKFHPTLNRVLFAWFTTKDYVAV